MSIQDEVVRFLRDLNTLYGPPQPGFTYKSTADLLLDRAVFDGCGGQQLNTEQSVFIQQTLRGCKAKYKECFGNAQALALKSDRFTYREGYAHSVFFPMHHAWVLLDNTHVVDVTWRIRVGGKPRRRVRGTVPDGWAYFGFTPDSAKERENIRERALRLGHWASYLNCDFFDDADSLDLYRLPRLEALP